MKSVLIIENDPDLIELLATIVERTGLVAVCIGEALDVHLIDQMKPDLILLDQLLDHGFGADFCREVKANESTQKIPIIMISAVTELEKIALDAGADSFVKKPFHIEELEAEILRHSG